MEYALLKSRSYRGVISTGFGLYLSHFRLFFKVSWLMALLFSAVFAALGMMVSVQLPAITASIMKQLLVQQAPLSMEMAQQYLMTAMAIILLVMLYVVVDAFTYATVLNKLKEHHDTGTMTVPQHWFSMSRRLMGRTLKGFLFTILVILIPGALLSGVMLILIKYVGVANITMIVTIVLVSLVLMLLSLPLIYVFMKYVMNSGTAYFSLLPKAYAIGLRHWGHIFTTYVIGYLLVGVLAMVCTLPANILSKAHFASQEGFLNGDALGMPSYITPLTIGTFFLTGFILVYLCLPMVMIAYYLYGSIVSYENEKTKIDI